MKREPYKRIFQTNINALENMFYDYVIHNWTVTDLAKRYSVDRASIIYQLKKHNLHKIQGRGGVEKSSVGRPKKNETRKQIEKYISDTTPVKREYSKTSLLYVDERGEPLNPGKMYKQYLEDDKKKSKL